MSPFAPEQEPAESQIPEPRPALWADLNVLQQKITERMEAARKKGRVIGWASSVSRGDGSEPYSCAGGSARLAHEVTEYSQGPPEGTRYGQVPRVIGHHHEAATPMTPDTRLNLASCSKTVTAVAALAAQWKISTHHHPDAPRSLQDLQQVVTVNTLQAQAQDHELAKLVPRSWDRSRINGRGVFSLMNPPPLPLRPQTTPIKLHHLMTFRSYLIKGTADGHYQDVKAAIELGPILQPETDPVTQNVTIPPIGKGPGVYSNAGYEALRIAIAYTLARVPELTGNVSVQDLDHAHWHDRDFMTCLIHQQFVQNHVFRPCGVEGVLHPEGEIAYYNVDAPNHQHDFEWIDTGDTFFGVGASGWYMSANELRKFMVGVQQGKPFGNDRSWWTDVIAKKWYGSDCPWLTHDDFIHSFKTFPDGAMRRIYRKEGGLKYSFSDGDRWGHAGVQTKLEVYPDATVVILLNCRGDTPSIGDVIEDAYGESLR